MKRVLPLILFFSFLSFFGYTQPGNFIYLQTENAQTFYVKMNNRLHSSAAAGYLILHGLKDSTYRITVGFPKNEWPEQVFVCSPAGKDAGYLLKNFGDRGWGLFNLQALTIQMASDNKAAGSKTNIITSKDPFTTLLATVVGDSTIREQVVRVEEKGKTEGKTEVKVEGKTETKAETKVEERPVMPPAKVEEKAEGEVRVETKTEVKTETKTEIKAEDKVEERPAVSVERSKVGKLIESRSAGGVDMVFTDAHAAGSDTIRLFVPELKEQVEAPAKPQAAETKTTIAVVTDTIRHNVQATEVQERSDSMKIATTTAQTDTMQKDKRFLDFEMNPNDSLAAGSVKRVVAASPDSIKMAPDAGAADTIKTDTRNIVAANDSTASPQPGVQAPGEKPEPATPKLQVVNSDCRSFATEDDFFKLRGKMSNEKSDDDMIDAAKKAFKKKCYSTEQVKNLGVLFLSDEARYKFYDTAYPFVHDTGNYARLEQELKEEYYRNRFRAMIRK
jgi:Domain of unknown function (DUF4476)